MTPCAACGSSIVFGGVQADGDVYCNRTCRDKGRTRCLDLPDSIVQGRARAVHQSACPKCNRPGPTDLHVAHWAWSALLFTQWGSTPLLGCRRCGNLHRLTRGLATLVFGWWGMPWGFLMTPIQVIRNLVGALHGPDPSRPSAALVRAVRLGLGEGLVADEDLPPVVQGPPQPLSLDDAYRPPRVG